MEYEKCSVTGKRCYSKVDAQRAVNLATKKHWKNKNPVVPKRVYFCRFCSSYHLTKEAVKHDGNKTKRKYEARYSNERRRAERMEKDIFRYRREYQ